MPRYKQLFLLILLLGMSALLFFAFAIPQTEDQASINLEPTPPSSTAIPTVAPTPITPTVRPTLVSSLVEPTAEFQERITKKPFGIFITPENSPVSPERFSGYHTGVDVEYEDVTSAVPVLAVANGKVIWSGTVSVYGGIIVIEHVINQEVFTGLYGHLEPSSLQAEGSLVSAGEQIGILGAGKTAATDGERKHLHFSLHKGPGIELKGYISSENQLNQWVDPLDLFN